MFDLPTIGVEESTTNQGIVFSEQLHEGGFTDLVEQRGRSLQIREENGAEWTRLLGRIRRLLNPAEKPEHIVLRDGDDLIR